MGRIHPIRNAHPARAFVEAATRLAGQAVLVLTQDPLLGPRAARALDLATEATARVERVAREGGDVIHAYASATLALEAARATLLPAPAADRFGPFRVARGGSAH